MRIHIATLFNCDAYGRIRSLGRAWSRPGGAPRFFMGRRRDGNVWLFRDDLPDEQTRELEVLCRSEPSTKDLRRPPRFAPEIRAALQGLGPITREYRGPAYLIPEGTEAPPYAVLITKEEGRMLEAGFPWMLPHLRADVDIGPVTAAVVNGSAVSICYCARLLPWPPKRALRPWMQCSAGATPRQRSPRGRPPSAAEDFCLFTARHGRTLPRSGSPRRSARCATARIGKSSESQRIPARARRTQRPGAMVNP